MKVLYAIQGTGNGHVSRAREIVPILQKMCDLDLLISGIQVDIDLPHEVKYRHKGLSFIFGKKGGVDIWKTYKKAKIRRFRKEMNSLPVEDYDLIINDFEPLSAWAAYRKKVPCIALSHQCAVLSSKAPQPDKTELFGKFVLKNYAPASSKYGFHFQRYEENIFTPVIRSEVRSLKPKKKNHYTVYLPAYDDITLIEWLNNFKQVNWEVFSKHNKKPINLDHIKIRPVDNKGFVKSMVNSTGILCGAGFETPAEALYLNKKLLVVPMKTQYEQQCNAATLKAMGVPVIKSLKSKHIDGVREWLDTAQALEVNYPDEVQEILESILTKHEHDAKKDKVWKKRYDFMFD